MPFKKENWEILITKSKRKFCTEVRCNIQANKCVRSFACQKRLMDISRNLKHDEGIIFEKILLLKYMCVYVVCMCVCEWGGVCKVDATALGQGPIMGCCKM
jgi:hypothetical protein